MDMDAFREAYPSTGVNEITVVYYHRLKSKKTGGNLDTIAKCAKTFGVSLRDYMKEGWL